MIVIWDVPQFSQLPASTRSPKPLLQSSCTIPIDTVELCKPLQLLILLYEWYLCTKGRFYSPSVTVLLFSVLQRSYGVHNRVFYLELLNTTVSVCSYMVRPVGAETNSAPEAVEQKTIEQPRYNLRARNTNNEAWIPPLPHHGNSLVNYFKCVNSTMHYNAKLRYCIIHAHVHIKTLFSISNYLMNSLTHLANVSLPSYNANNSCGMVYAALRQFKTASADPRHSVNWFAVCRHCQLPFAVPRHSKAAIDLDDSSGEFYNVSDD